MPRNGSSVYSYPPGSRGQPNTTISSSKYNTLIDDVAQTFNTLQPVVLGGTGANTADGAAKELGLVSAKDMAGVNTVGGTANAVTITTERVYTALTTSLFLRFVAESDIAAGGMTINLDGIGAKPVKKVVAAGQVDVNAGDIIEGGYYEITYDPTSDNGEDEDGAFILLNPGSSSAYLVGDFFDTARTLNTDWLRRNGALYDSADYPELAAILPSLPDGVTWSNSNAITSGTIRRSIKTSTGFLMMVDDGANTRVYTTDNSAVTWSQVSTINSFRVADFTLQSGVYVAGDGLGKVSASNDGVSWSAPSAVLSFTGIGGVAFGSGLFVVGGDGGKIATSPDGATWTSRSSGVTQFLYKVRFLNSIFIALGADGTILTSPDGINWTARTSGVTVILYDVVYAAGLYVIVGGSGTILTSSNLSSWTARTSSTAQDLYAAEYSTAGFMAAGSLGTVRISTDALTWASSATGTSVSFQTILADPNNQSKYFVGGNGALYVGTRTLPTQFRVPDDNPTYGWIKAVS